MVKRYLLNTTDIKNISLKAPLSLLLRTANLSFHSSLRARRVVVRGSRDHASCIALGLLGLHLLYAILLLHG